MLTEVYDRVLHPPFVLLGTQWTWKEWLTLINIVQITLITLVNVCAVSIFLSRYSTIVLLLMETYACCLTMWYTHTWNTHTWYRYRYIYIHVNHIHIFKLYIINTIITYLYWIKVLPVTRLYFAFLSNTVYLWKSLIFFIFFSGNFTPE